MYKKIFTISAFALISGIAFGQSTGRVGINTTTPATTLDIKGKTADGAAVEGVMTPQVSGDALKAMKDKMGAAQNGNLVFVTSAVTTPDAATDNVTFPGYYRFNYDPANTTNPKSFVRMEPSGLEKVPASSGFGNGYQLINAKFDNTLGTYKGFFSVDLSFATNNLVNEQTDNHPNWSMGGFKGFKVIVDQTSGASTYSPTQFYNPTYYATLETAFHNPQLMGASGDLSFAQGYNVVASGPLSFARGIDIVSSGSNSFVNGFLSKASGDYSTVIGTKNTASGESSVVIGYGNLATNVGSIAIGQSAQSTGYGSIAIGTDVFSNNSYEVALGNFNFSTPALTGDQDAFRQIFSVGNGMWQNPKNALIITNNGYTGLSLPTDTATPANSKPTEMLDVNGNIRVRGTGSEPTGSCSNPGAISYYNDTFYGCTSAGWKKLSFAP